jgi:hypothetical protein
MGSVVYAVMFVVLGYTVGKVCQYCAVAYLGARLGFEYASLVGLTPFVVLLVLLKARYPRYFDFRAIGR